MIFALVLLIAQAGPCDSLNQWYEQGAYERIEQTLLEGKCDIKNGSKFLSRLCKDGQWELAQLVATQDIIPNIGDIERAIVADRLDVLKVFIQSHREEYKSRGLPINTAIYLRHEGALRWLLKTEASLGRSKDPRQVDRRADRLPFASECAWPLGIEILLEQDYDPNQPDPKGASSMQRLARGFGYEQFTHRNARAGLLGIEPLEIEQPEPEEEIRRARATYKVLAAKTNWKRYGKDIMDEMVKQLGTPPGSALFEAAVADSHLPEIDEALLQTELPNAAPKLILPLLVKAKAAGPDLSEHGNTLLTAALELKDAELATYILKNFKDFDASQAMIWHPLVVVLEQPELTKAYKQAGLKEPETPQATTERPTCEELARFAEAGRLDLLDAGLNHLRCKTQHSLTRLMEKVIWMRYWVQVRKLLILYPEYRIPHLQYASLLHYKQYALAKKYMERTDPTKIRLESLCESGDLALLKRAIELGKKPPYNIHCLDEAPRHLRGAMLQILLKNGLDAESALAAPEVMLRPTTYLPAITPYLKPDVDRLRVLINLDKKLDPQQQQRLGRLIAEKSRFELTRGNIQTILGLPEPLFELVSERLIIDGFQPDWAWRVGQVYKKEHGDWLFDRIAKKFFGDKHFKSQTMSAFFEKNPKFIRSTRDNGEAVLARCTKGKFPPSPLDHDVSLYMLKQHPAYLDLLERAGYKLSSSAISVYFHRLEPMDYLPGQQGYTLLEQGYRTDDKQLDEMPVLPYLGYYSGLKKLGQEPPRSAVAHFEKRLGEGTQLESECWRMLKFYDPAGTATLCVANLSHESNIRRLWAISQLNYLAGTTHGYDFKNPEGPQPLQAWQEWLKKQKPALAKKAPTEVSAFGIGVSPEFRDSSIWVKYVGKDSGAERSGLRNKFILAINGIPLSDYPIDELPDRNLILDLLAGKKDTTVRLTVIHLINGKWSDKQDIEVPRLTRVGLGSVPSRREQERRHRSPLFR